MYICTNLFIFIYYIHNVYVYPYTYTPVCLSIFRVNNLTVYLCHRLPIRLSLLSFILHYLATYLSVCISSALVHLFLYVHKSEVNQPCYSLSV